MDHRPGQLPGGNRPGGIGGGNNNIIGNRPGGIGNGNNIIGGGNTIIGGGNNINVNRPGWGVDPGFSNRPGNRWNNHWHNNWQNHCVHPRYRGWYNGCWSGGMWGNYWYAPLAFGATVWGLGAMTANYGYGVAYENPYYEPVAAPAYNYSQPVVINNYVSSDATGGESQATADAQSSESAQMFDSALEAFKSGDYSSALARSDNALKQQPKDPVIHEVRALCLFALGKYQPAAATLNSLLASAPGMDWTTMSGLYGNADDYTTQLRALESHLRANPKDASASFVLAYHYLVLGETKPAIKALKMVVEQQPKDGTAKRMLDALSASDEEDAAEKPMPPDSPDAPPATDLVGTWTAKANKTTVELTIDEDSNFVWKASTPGQDVQEIRGTTETTAETLELTSDNPDQGIMAGKVKSGGADKFTFQFTGSPSSDPGLAFTRTKK